VYDLRGVGAGLAIAAEERGTVILYADDRGSELCKGQSHVSETVGYRLSTRATK